METFQPYGLSHWVVLAVLGLGLVPAVLLGRRDRDRRISRVFAVVVLALAIPSQALVLTRQDYELHASLPLQLSDLAWLVAAWALWTHHRLPVALTYYWGLGLTTQAAVTPALREEFPDPAFFVFWGQHHLIVWAAVFLIWGVRLRPNWWSYWMALGISLGWMVVVFGVNSVLGTNYGFVNRKPETPSVLDLFGPWPVYLVVEIVVVAAVWALMTWPWTRSCQRTAPRQPVS